MPVLSGAEIQQNLRTFVQRWRSYDGTERSESQTFVNELFATYGQDRRDAGALLEERQTTGGIMDLIYPGTAIIEMKAPSEADRLDRHRAQALEYWHHSDDPSTGRPAPPFVVLCAFRRFEIWEPGQYPSAPRAVFSLEELPDQYEALDFLAGRDPLFTGVHRHLTTEAARAIALLNESLTDRRGADPATVRRFLLQLVWCMFAESLGLLEGHPIERIVAGLLDDGERSSAAELGYLFDVLNSTDQSLRGGLYSGAPYANGGLFAVPARVHLIAEELRVLAEAATFDWREVDPTIFGALMEECLGRARRWELGAHYTHEVDILRIVRPSIVAPFSEGIDAATTLAEAIEVLERLCSLRVLDPACGCGNFLYVAYRELRNLEQRAKGRIDELARASGVAAPAALPSYPISNLYGIEIDEFAALIARVTLWMGHKLVTDAHGLVEPVLPLVDLSGIRVGDALRVDWPEADVIIGNPPFQGSQHLRQILGDDYVAWLKDTFKCGVQDYCVYWFRRAADHLGPGGRAGLVGTNSVSQNRARGASLDYVVEHGGIIVSALSTEKWPGDAKVHVSIVNWVKSPAALPPHYVLDDENVPGITTSLTPEDGLPKVVALPANAGRCFQGPIPVGAGFILDDVEARRLLSDGGVPYYRVVRPYLFGEDIATDPVQHPRRWIIDFASMPLEEARRYPAALAIIEERVRPERKQNRDKGFRATWWQFGRPRGEMRRAIAGLSRYLASTATGKRLLLTWCEPSWCPSNLTNVFAFDDDYAFGVLTSAAHVAWAWHRSSTLKGDLRYTPTTVFASFPWPSPVSEDQRAEVGRLAGSLFATRQSLCAAHQVGLTRLYNTMDDGGYRELAALHAELDRVVAACYGWPAAICQDHGELVNRLAHRNAAVASGDDYEPFAPLPPLCEPVARQTSFYDP
ncbi:MAG: DNA methyltransferase [Acidimicrobiales bacterium]